MVRFFIARLLQLFITLFLLASIVFLIMRVLPGDPAVRIAGLEASAETVARMQEKLGTDKSIMQQYLDWLRAVMRFDFGISFVHTTPVAKLIMQSLPYSLLLALPSFLLSMLLSLSLAVLAQQSRYLARLVQGVELFFLSMPTFWIALIAVLLFSVYFNLLPSFGHQGLQSYILPVISLGLANAPFLIRQLRVSLQEEIRKPYILFTRSCGFSSVYVLLRAAIPNAAIPFIHVAAIQFGYLLGGNIIIESVFVIPGLGRLLLQSIFNRDYPLVQASILIFAALFILCLYLGDILLYAVNPRLRVLSNV